MSPSLFVDSMRRVFASVSDDNIRSIWRLAQTAVGQSKGTMLVVTTAAAQEAKRLARRRSRSSRRPSTARCCAP